MTEKSTSGDSSPVERDTYAGKAKMNAGEVVLGSFTGLDSSGKPRVSFVVDGEQFENCEAKSTVPLSAGEAGRQVVLMFIEQNLSQPVISGFIHNNLDTVLSLTQETLNAEDQTLFSEDSTAPAQLEIDGEPQDRLVFEGKDEIVLKCGEASITLSRDGKLILRGKYILNRSSGVNRILGSSVRVN
ncbi:hypothetical protein P886_3275 [Alteromonadaceae bacterium 2753L.S.0a.02]|nr:hypothetical protein P886_3275 [Alteromonadaceae bacterium 2753L.S.0a.02]